MPNDNKKVPEAFERNAPRFDDDEPEELPQFLEYMERMMELDKTEDNDKNAFIVRYALRRPAKEWKKFESYTKSYKEFKKEILENYPAARDSKKGSIRVLNKALREFDSEDISEADADELMKLIRAMNVETSKLLKSGLLTHREAVPLFMDKLEAAFQRKILFNIDQIRERTAGPVQAADDSDDEDDNEGGGYTFNEVVTEAKRLVKKHNNNLDYFNTSSRREKKGKGRSLTVDERVIKNEPDERSLNMLGEIKMALVHMADRLSSENKEAKAATMEEIRQFYKSIPGTVPGAPNAQTMPPRQEVRFRPVNASDLCHYCQEAGSHWIANCPHRKRHIAEGLLKILNGRECFPNGVLIPLHGNKSRRQLVEEYQHKQPAPRQVNFASSYMQQGPGLYALTTEEQVAVETDSGEGYGYYDPNEYDSRDDEIMTMRVEQQNLMRQLAQFQRPPAGGVQPPLAAQGSESQLAVGTRANPSRTGNGSDF